MARDRAARSGGGGAPSPHGLVPSGTSPKFPQEPTDSLALQPGDLVCSIDQFGQARKRNGRMRKSVWNAGRAFAMPRDGFRPAVAWFVTLTYAEPDAWEARHISNAIKAYRKWCKSVCVPCRYVWVAEIQPGRLERTGDAVVHYHLVCWVPPGITLPKWDVSVGRRDAFWAHGMTNREKAYAGVGYLMKYLSKLGEIAVFPKGLRIYGIGGLDDAAKAVGSWLNLPEWAKRSYGVRDLARCAGRLVVRATGETAHSPYSVRLVPGAIVLRLVGELPPRCHDGPYSTLPGLPVAGGVA